MLLKCYGTYLYIEVRKFPFVEVYDRSVKFAIITLARAKISVVKKEIPTPWTVGAQPQLRHRHKLKRLQ